MDIRIDQCKVPLCENIQDVVNGWPICSECMANTVRRFKMFLPSVPEEDIIRTVVNNIDDLVRKEQETINNKGPDYDRDEG